MKTLYWILLVIIIIGSLNWGAVGLLEYNPVAAIFGEKTIITEIIYSFIGVAAIGMILMKIGRCIYCIAMPEKCKPGELCK